MLIALRQPATFLGLLLGFVVGMLALTAATRLLDRNSRYSDPVWHPRAWLDPFGTVAAMLAGGGWAPRPEVRRGFGKSQQRQLWAVAALSLVIPAVLGAVALAIYANSVGQGPLSVMKSMWVLHGEEPVKLLFANTTGQQVALGFGIENLTIAVLSLVPIPPLPTGVAVWSTLPRKPGARQMAHRLLEEHWGIAALLVLFLIPLGGNGPLLLVLVTEAIDNILHAF